jgi:hypothetical protein
MSYSHSSNIEEKDAFVIKGANSLKFPKLGL